jgi:acyl-[acyl carrier protein]--UDP-N-acetylglucosamine O-acyltransferase
MQMHDVDHGCAVIHFTASVSADAAVGTPAEWRGRTSQHPACVDDLAVVREFAVVHAGVERETRIGSRTLVASGAYVGHDTHIGADCDIAPGAKIAGCVTIGDRCKIGIGAVVCPNVSIPDDTRIGGGAVVIRDIEPDVVPQTWVGNPARRIR